MNKNFSRLLFLIIVAIVLLIVLYKCGFMDYLTLENLKAQSLYLRSWVISNYIFSALVYIFVYFLVIALAIPAVAPLSLIGGFLFGTIYGFLYAIFALTAGATFDFLLFRSVLREAIAVRYEHKLATFKRGLMKHGGSYLLILHFAVLIPSVVINILAALADVSVWLFIWTTVVGFIPSAMLYAFAGSQITQIKSVYDIFSFQIILAFVLLILLALLPIVLKKLKLYRGI